jgi:hypothetical protein
MSKILLFILLITLVASFDFNDMIDSVKFDVKKIYQKGDKSISLLNSSYCRTGMDVLDNEWVDNLYCSIFFKVTGEEHDLKTVTARVYNH